MSICNYIFLIVFLAFCRNENSTQNTRDIGINVDSSLKTGIIKDDSISYFDGLVLYVQRNNFIMDSTQTLSKVEPQNHQLIKEIIRYRSFNNFDQIKSIKSVGLVSKNGTVIGKAKYYSRMVVQEWLLTNETEAKKCSTILDENKKAGFYLKPPQIHFQHGNCIYYALVRAEMFRNDLKIVESFSKR